VDSTFIRSREEGDRHLEVRVGNIETASGGRHVFGAVAKADTDLSALIHRNLRAVGLTDNTEVTAFTDGGPGLRSILVNAGITTPPILDWFHIAMRMQHAAQTARSLPTDDPGRIQAKSVIVEEVERLRWRIWNGKAKNARRSIDRVRKVIHAYKEERTRPMRGRRLTGYGIPCLTSTATSEARVVGSSTTLSGTVPTFGSERLSLREPQTFSSTVG
jgi:hypothetical protein